jgi:cation:H+ antiporter
MAYWIIAAGLLLLVLGSEAVVRGGVWLGRAFGLSPLLIGIVVVSTATSAPELFVSLRAATMGAPDIALGGIVGGNILDLLLVLGLGALILPMAAPPKVVLRDGGAMLAGALALASFALDGELSREDGLFLLAGFVVYIAAIFFTDWRRSADHSVPQARAEAMSQGEPPPAIAGLFLLIFGTILLVLGAHFSVSGGVALARDFNLHEAFIGLTVVAFGTALPKLIATLVAAARGHTNLAVGHVIGACAFNLLGVLGLTAVVSPLSVSTMLGSLDIPVMTAASAIMLPLLAMKWRLSRPRGALLLVAYAGYLAFVFWRQGLLTLHGIG